MGTKQPINADGLSTAQVTDEVKEALAAWLSQYEVRSVSASSGESSIIFSCYQGGDYVAVSAIDTLGPEQTKGFNRAKRRALEMYWRNKEIHDDCFWVHRQWINDLLEHYNP